MNEVMEKRAAVTVIDELNLKHGDIRALLSLLTVCDKDECDVNGAAYALERIVEDADKLASELYAVGGAS